MKMTQLVHSNLHLHRSINLNRSNALHNFHRTKFSHLGISTYATRSITLLWILISRCSQVLVPSPQGDLRVVMRRNLVGIRTGPETLTLLLRARRLISEHTIQSNSTTAVTFLHSPNVGGSKSNTNAVNLLVNNFILLHWCFFGLWTVSIWIKKYAEMKYRNCSLKPFVAITQRFVAPLFFLSSNVSGIADAVIDGRKLM